MEMRNSVLSRVLGTGASAADGLGAYKDANGNTTTCRPEFAGQTVQLGSYYVTYNEKGYPIKSFSVQHAKELGNDYTMEHFGLDQTKVVNAGDIYRSVYNAAMEKAELVSGSALDNAFAQRNIQYDGTLGLEDYDTLIREAVAAGNNVLAGFYEDSRNALIADQGLSPALQTSTYNGGWNYVDSGGGIGNIGDGALKDTEQPDQAVGGGWFAGQGKGDAEKEYIYCNPDAPTLEEVMDYAASHGYTVNDENAARLFEELALQMMAGGYVSPETLRKADALKEAIPAVLEKLGMESSNTGIDALDAAIRRSRNVDDQERAAAQETDALTDTEE
ncbi:MAG: hypothetical protein IKC24_00205 [Oscillospiraceae bacterium]|nr:hypothetical protein [Oscillospiraceae bacterium]